MKTSTIVWIVVIILVLVGGWYWWSMQSSPATGAPTGQAGINGSPNQGNMGGADNLPAQAGGQVQQPMADGAEGMIIGANLALGISGNAKAGTYLVAYNGMVVYTKSTDIANTSTCYGTCAKNWPPYLVGAEDNVHQVKTGVTGKVDTIVRTDGGIQVTYNGKPLYFYAGDKTSADVTGTAITGWSVVKP